MVLIRRVEGQSMYPTLPAGKIVLAWRWLKPKVGDIVVARHRHMEIVKRIADLKGDSVYVVGDNPACSTDSRQFGWLPLAAVLGVVRARGAA